MKKISLLICLLFTVLGFQLNGQQAQNVYVELLGNGVVYSVNYDMRLAKKDNQLGFRSGLAILPEAGYIILQPNYLFGAKQHKFELGLGATALITTDGNTELEQVVASGALMYRFQRPDGHFLFRAGLSPTFVPVDENDTFSGLARVFWIWPGVSFGYKF
ncbi:MAG: hypothetical protein AAF847_11330 [Bacteroidota bacterium]